VKVRVVKQTIAQVLSKTEPARPDRARNMLQISLWKRVVIWGFARSGS
jgi:hypothetical protein